MGKTTKNKENHPYLKPNFWYDKKNHYWETDMYTDKGKEYLRGFVKELKEENRRSKDDRPIVNSKNL